MKKILLSLSILLATLCAARAGTHVWSGAVNGYWSNPGNWSSGGVPAFGETSLVLRYPPEGHVRRDNTNDIAQLTVQSIIFTGHYYYLAGNPITMAMSAGLNFLTSASNVNNEVSMPIILPNGTYTVSVPETSRLTLSGPISGPGAVIKYGEGVLGFEGPQGNTFTGGFYHKAGSTDLIKTLGVALVGPVYIGQTNAVAQMGIGYGFHNQIADAANVYVWGGQSVLYLNGYNDTVNSLDIIDGKVSSGITTYNPDGSYDTVPGTLRINGDVTVAEAIRNDGHEPELAGRLNLGNVQHTFNVQEDTRLLFYADVSSTGTNGGITLQGGGLLQIQGSNSFTGPLRVVAGDIIAFDSAAFGSPVGVTYIDGADCKLTLGYGQFVKSESLHVASNAQLVSIGTNAWNGPIHVKNNAKLALWGHGFGGTDWLTLSGPISGPGNLEFRMDRISLVGTEANTLSGMIELYDNTELYLKKTNANALSGTVFLRGGYSSSPQIYWQTNNQIADTSRVVFDEEVTSNAGTLHLYDFYDTIGSLHGGPYATIFCGKGQLTVGGNNQDGRFYGWLNGNAGTTNLAKIGTGILLIEDYQSLHGKTVVNGGTLILSNVYGVNAVHVNSGGRLAASGKLGALTASGTGRIEPGLQLGDFSYAKLSPASFNIAGGVYRCGIGGTEPGVSCDQIETAGPLFISGSLELTSFNIPTATNSYTIINVTNTALTLGAFLGLPEGAEFTSLNGHSFRITYHGGDGNDVVVTRVGPLPPGAQISGVTPQSDGQMRILATGIPGMTYKVQATTNLVPAAWVDLGTTFADGGWLEFIDTDAPNHPVRFYRFVLP